MNINEEKSVEIGTIGNYYGSLSTVEQDGKFYWGIENFDGTHWEEIPESLHKELIDFNKSQKEEK